MQAYDVTLSSPISDSYRCKRAADSLDIDANKKAIHSLKVNADLETDYNIGLIIGASGSGKTTLAKKIFGNDCFKTILDEEKSIIDQFPESFEYDKCAEILSGVGLTQVPCWIRPVKTLSNGQRARSEAALLMCSNEKLTIIDEWTSVVDRTVAKVMSHCIQKFARKNDKKIVLLSCHYDVIEWLNPDWIIDCNKQQYTDRRLLRQGYERQEKLKFDIRETGRETWKYFSKYHYLSDKMPAGHIETFGLFNDENQIGFICYANYVPYRKSDKNKGVKKIMHSNRVVIHPDYAGIGLGILLCNATANIMHRKGYRVMAKFSSIPMYKSRIKDKNWCLIDIKRKVGSKTSTRKISRQSGYRCNIKTYSFEYIAN